MNKVRKTIYKEKEILLVDYSGSRGEELISIFEEAKKLVQLENKHVLILTIFDTKTFISPALMRHVEGNLREVENLIDKQAIIGLSVVQEWILKGMNVWYKRQIHSFTSQEEASEFLIT